MVSLDPPPPSVESGSKWINRKAFIKFNGKTLNHHTATPVSFTVPASILGPKSAKSITTSRPATLGLPQLAGRWEKQNPPHCAID
ncbi:hypothetical protein ZHAS_00012408 [Anopheles sinensis]|uniref:Uncharacterized protein n=1 Tax=Anopheles sinensis TaxID=74873 RepID=A0A084W2T4_ANOSI|nr:hypothetical protein ZHAS_00012408 [Anopheles sinensis]